MKQSVWLFNDNDGENGELYVAAIQVRNGKASRDEARALGPSALGIPCRRPCAASGVSTTATSRPRLAKRWNTLTAPRGRPPRPILAPPSLEIEGVNGKTRNVMKAGHVGANANFGYILRHNIEPNGGGKKSTSLAPP